MKIKRLILENFRGARLVAFRDTLDFDDRLNVFYGENGAGKSTVLEAMGIALSTVSAKVKTIGAVGAGIKDEDIRHGCMSTSIKIDAKTATGLHTWHLGRHRQGHAVFTKKNDYSGANDVARELAADFANGRGLPAMVFYPVTRAVLDIPNRIRTRHDFEAHNTYDSAFSGSADFRVFFEWFRNREDIENQSARDNGGRIISDWQLTAVRRAIEKHLPEISDIRIMRAPPLHMQAVKHGIPLNVDQLSDGEKCMLAMIGDLARRLAMANEGNDIDPLQGNGIVLIDEIDLHLHPQWQRLVVERLLDTFPQCQFFLSTHSPLVLNGIRPNNLYFVENENGEMQVSRPGESFGKSVERILEDLMRLDGTLPREIAEPLDKLFNDIAAGDIESAKSIMGQLRDTGYDEPELNKAEMLIRRHEVIGK